MLNRTIGGARSAAITTAGLALSSGLNFLAIFIWVRLLGPHEFGIYALVSGVGLFLNAMLFEWLRVVGARTLYDASAEHAIDGSRADALLQFVAVIALVFVAVAGLLWAGGISGPGFDADWLPLLVVFTLSEMALAMLNVTSRVRMLPWQFFVAMVARSAVAIVLGLVFVVGLRMGAVGVMLGIVIAQAGTAIVLMARDPLWRGLRAGRSSRAVAATRREVLALGLPLILSAALSYGAGIADRYLVQGVLGTAQVGYYTAPADMLQKTLGFLMLAINIAAYPALVRAFEDHGAPAARKVLEDNFVVQLLLGLPVAVAFIVMPSGLSNLLLGGAYRDAAAALLPWIAVAALLRLLTSLHLLMVFQVTRHMRMMVVAPVVSLVVLVPAGIWGMRTAGLAGMAYAALVAQAVSWIVCALLARRIFPFALANADVGKVVLASAAFGAVLYPFRALVEPIPVMLAVGGAGIVLVIALLLLRLDRAQPIITKLRARLNRA